MFGEIVHWEKNFREVFEEKPAAASLPLGRCPVQRQRKGEGCCVPAASAPLPWRARWMEQQRPRHSCNSPLLFVLFLRGSLGSGARPSGQIMGGRSDKAARGQREERWKNGTLSLPRPLPPACWANFEMDETTVTQEPGFLKSWPQWGVPPPPLFNKNI